jgi:hypothetical protein
MGWLLAWREAYPFQEGLVLQGLSMARTVAAVGAEEEVLHAVVSYQLPWETQQEVSQREAFQKQVETQTYFRNPGTPQEGCQYCG